MTPNPVSSLFEYSKTTRMASEVLTEFNAHSFCITFKLYLLLMMETCKLWEY